MSKTETKKEEQDKTTADKNSKAPAIKFPVSKLTGVHPSNRKENTEIELKFSEAQLLEKGKKLCKTLCEKGILQNEKKSNAQGFQDKIDAKQSEIESLTGEIQAGFETKLVSCEIMRNFDSGKREYHYQEKKVKEEPLRASDHQLEIDVKEEKVN